MKHVVILKAMVDRHLKRDHRFLLVTDRPDDAPDGIETFRIWNDFTAKKGCWNRLKAFSPELEKVFGPEFVSIDLDMTICGELDSLFDHDDPLKMQYGYDQRKCPVNGGFFHHRTGTLPHIWTGFQHDPVRAMQSCRHMIGTDQAWIAKSCENAGHEIAIWGEDDGLYMHRYVHPSYPDNSRVINFAGAADPSLMDHPFIREHWREI